MNDEALELPSSKAIPPSRSSSKKSRAAEFHNLSEKRRRSKINEKLKALQNLIPNSNKTDKASILHLVSLSGGSRPTTFSQTDLFNLDKGNTGFHNSVNAIASSANDECFAPPSFSFPEQGSISNQTVTANIANFDPSSSFQPSIKA
ncbi:hypothetical protein KIW84_066113 [Lathyrus oleraceus]|uniref:BHLH domain-containing protein n=1 Tax=Pisum sativum TaxID=3888 RepID=A0A9D4WIN8_PEA|nr:hypothetical protein KIW84_066113 [Pisum sativum]